MPAERSSNDPFAPRPPRPADARSVAAATARDLDALSTLYDRHSARAYAVAWAILRTRPGAEHALTDGTLDLWRHRTAHPLGGASGRRLLCRVSAHALEDRHLGRSAAGPLSALTDTQCQVVALASAGGLSRAEIADETGLSPTTVARTMTKAAAGLRARAHDASRTDDAAADHSGPRNQTAARPADP